MQATVPPSPEHSLCSGNAGVRRHLHARSRSGTHRQPSQSQPQPQVDQQREGEQQQQQQHGGHCPQDEPGNDVSESAGGQQRHPFIFNVHPLAAGCFPATPVHGVSLYRARQHETPLWFTVPLLLYLYCQRKHIQRMAMTKAAAALQDFHEHMPHSTFPSNISNDRSRQALSTALNHFAEMWERASSQLGAPEGLAAACTVCKRGHLSYLMQHEVDGHAVFADQDAG